MVLLKDLFMTLATGEFSNLSFNTELAGNTIAASHHKIVDHLNLGLIEIYKRFRFLEGELRLHVDPTVSMYYLREDRLASLDNISTSRYIERPTDYEGFLNILELTGVFDEAGTELKINKRSVAPVIRQMAPDVLKITKLDSAQILELVYQASPSRIVLDADTDLTTAAVAIPDTIIEPLLFYVASRVFKPVGANNSTAQADKSASYQQQYELACQKLTLLGLDFHDNDQDDHFTADGWV
jgi:hypothetical protein